MKDLLERNKIFLIIYGTIISLIVLLSLFNYNIITFFLISVLVNTFIINIIKEIKIVLKIEFTKIDYFIIIGIILLGYLYYGISLLTRNFIYYWDYSCYYNIQIETIETFKSGLIEGLRYFKDSTWSGEYGNFLSFIPEALFGITNHTPNSYVSSCILIFIPYITFSLSILLKKLFEIFKVEKKELLLGILLGCFMIFPVLHATAIFGQPDFFGLFFIFLIISLTLSYNFEKLDIERLVLLFILTYLLFICRRWYVYWLLAYYICYVISIIISNIKDKNILKNIIKNLSIFAIISIVIFMGTLHPLLKNIIESDFKNHYIYYMAGGFVGELFSQKNILGTAILLLIIVGYIIGFIKKEYRKYAINSFVQIFIIIFLFTRIQNMGYHHSLTLLPSYLFGIMILILFFEKKKNYFVKYIVLGVFLLNFINGLIGLNNPIFTDIKLKVPKQEDYKEIEEVATWLEDNLSEEKTAYMITHTDRYNPDKFRNIFKPDRTIEHYLPYGSAIIGTHVFPTELFTATYVITTTPFEVMSIEYKYEDVFELLVKEGTFSLEKSFDMKNGYHVLIYKRVKEVTKEEVEMYKDILKEESKEFPELYEDILNEYEKNL